MRLVCKIADMYGKVFVLLFISLAVGLLNLLMEIEIDNALSYVLFAAVFICFFLNICLIDSFNYEKGISPFFRKESERINSDMRKRYVWLFFMNFILCAQFNCSYAMMLSAVVFTALSCGYFMFNYRIIMGNREVIGKKSR